MPLLATGLINRGEAVVPWSLPGGGNTATVPFYIRVLVTQFQPQFLDVSLRYNPPWRTFGRLAVATDDPASVFFTEWINFPDQIFAVQQSPALLQVNALDELGIPLGTVIQTLRLFWDFRASVRVNVWGST